MISARTEEIEWEIESPKYWAPDRRLFEYNRAKEFYILYYIHVSFIIEAFSCSSFSFILSHRNYRSFYRFATVYFKYIKQRKRRIEKIEHRSFQATFHANNNNILTIFLFVLVCFYLYCFAHFMVYGFILRHGHRRKEALNVWKEKIQKMF